MAFVERRAGRSIAIVGAGISGLACAWLLNRNHNVTVFEADARIGGHSHTVSAQADGAAVAVDTGFIVYNEPCYPNLTRLFDALGVETVATDMSFAVSLDRGAYEYAGGNLAGLLAQPGNLAKRRFWSMLRDLLRFYREAPRDLATMGDQTLEDYLATNRYGASFRDDHLYPMAAAIWSTPAMDVGKHPAANFIRFCENHGLLRLAGRPQWRTVVGGSRNYVARLTASFAERIAVSCGVVSILRDGAGVELIDAAGGRRRFDAVVIATHADQALKMLAAPSLRERTLLGAFRYARNEAVLHTDASLMPRRRAAWASWNYLADGDGAQRRLSVTYWMNRLQPLGAAPPLFVTLNPLRARPRRRHPQRHIRAPAIRPRGHARAAGVVEPARAGQHLVLRGLVRRRLSRGRPAGRPRCRRGPGRAPAALERGQCRRPYLPAADDGASPEGVGKGVGMSAPQNSALYVGTVTHCRLRPRAHRLAYRIYSLLLDLDELERLDRRLRLFSVNRFNLFSFHEKDRGDGGNLPLRAQVEEKLRAAGLPSDGGAVKLLTMPRLLGWSFNPLSVFFCYRPGGDLTAILWEVDNTFGERHGYLLPAGAPGETVHQGCAKAFYVSPFMDMNLRYAFAVDGPDARLRIVIDALDTDGLILRTRHNAVRQPLTDAALARLFFSLPFQTLRVVFGIGWEALKLWLKGVRLRPRPSTKGDSA